MLASLQAVPPGDRAAWSLASCRQLALTPQFQQARVVMLYGASEFEPDCAELFGACAASGKVMAVPEVVWESRTMTPRRVAGTADLEPGRHGVHVPRRGAAEIDLGEIDLVVAPGIAFGVNGARVGRGAGFYDRFLAQPRFAGAAVGLAFEIQLVPVIEPDPWDRLMDAVATERRLVKCRRQ